MTWRVVSGKCVETMGEMEPESVHAVVCDPPYDLTGMSRGGSSRKPGTGPYGRHSRGTDRKGFMGKTWDGTGVAFDPKTWQAVLRVLKPGGFLLAFGGTRTYHRTACAVEDAGFEIRDRVLSASGDGVELGPELDWVYGSGFPKALDVGRTIRTERGATPETEKWKGWATALKPAYEPIVVARKPLDGTVVENVLRHETGGLNVGGCTIGTSKDVPSSPSTINHVYGDFSNAQGDTDGFDPATGRWPANMVLSHDKRCVLVDQEDTPGRTINRWADGMKPFGGGAGGEFSSEQLAEEVLEVWACVPRCPVRALDNQSSGVSRFFYCSKASAVEREAGLLAMERKSFAQSSGAQAAIARGEDYQGTDATTGMNRVKQRRNDHPTVKPIDLMRWLVRLVTPKGGTVLDPFLGSGTTGIAAVLEGFDFIGIDQDPDYVEISDGRISFWAEHPTDLPVEKALESHRKREKAQDAGQSALF